jgi:hypothetical protein
MNMLSFLENEHNGFSRFNGKPLYEEERKMDATGRTIVPRSLSRV